MNQPAKLPFDPRLSVAEHVSRREAGRHLDLVEEASAGLDAVLTEICRTVGSRFSRRRRLDEAEVRAVEGSVEARLRPSNPLLTHRLARATLSSKAPNVRETLAVVADSADVGGFEVCYLVGLRFYVDRKRAVIDRERMGLTISRHLLERAMERELVDRDAGFSTVEEALFEAQGVLVAWSHAVRLGLASADRDLHIPFGSGLLLGTAFRSRYPQLVRLRMDGIGCSPSTERTGGLRSLPGDEDSDDHLEWLGRTAVSEDLLSVAQVDYRDEIAAHCERWSSLFGRLRDLGAWSAPDLVSPVTPGSVASDLDSAARELVAIVEAPRHARVYVSKVEEDFEFLGGLSRRMTAHCLLAAKVGGMVAHGFTVSEAYAEINRHGRERRDAARP